MIFQVGEKTDFDFQIFHLLCEIESWNISFVPHN